MTFTSLLVVLRQSHSQINSSNKKKLYLTMIMYFVLLLCCVVFEVFLKCCLPHAAYVDNSTLKNGHYYIHKGGACCRTVVVLDCKCTREATECRLHTVKTTTGHGLFSLVTNTLPFL